MEPPLPEDHSFGPANHRLISVYLRRRVAGEPLPPAAAAYFHDVDIYAADPAALTAGIEPVAAGKGEASFWLFFTTLRSKSSTDRRKCRRVGGGLGTWHSEHSAEAVVDDEGKRVGQRQLFSYKGKDGKRSGWSMWEFSAAGEEGADSVLVLCKIHQGHAGSRRGTYGAAARATRKRKGVDDGADHQASARVSRRRIFAPPAPILPSASQDKIGAASEATLCSMTESVASKDTPRSVLSFWDEPATSEDKICSSSEFLPSFRTEPVALQEDIISSTSTMEEPPASIFLIPELEASQGDTTTLDHGFVMTDGAPVAAGYPANFMAGSSDMSAWSLCPVDASVSSIGYDTAPTCSVGNPFLGGLPTLGVEVSGSWNGCNTTASWFGENAFVDGLPPFDHWDISGSATGVQFGCSMPSAAFLPSTAPPQWCGLSSADFLPSTTHSQWCSEPSSWSC